jgi:molybdenum cofactor cytidylyltransferase
VPSPEPFPLPALVLAAGASQRMGRPKALLDSGGRTFVQRIVGTLAAASLSPVVVVTRAELAAAIARDIRPARVVVNPAPELGQLSSLRAGFEAIDPIDAGAVLVTLVDLPMVRADTVVALVKAWHDSHAPLVRPRVGAMHGHPMIIRRDVIAALRDPLVDLAAGAKPIIRRAAAWEVPVATDDEGTIADVDTPDDYVRFTRRKG